MAIKMRVPKEHNHIYYDFDDAYWKIEDINVGINSGDAYVNFRFTAYPNEEASDKEHQETQPMLNFGGPNRYNVENRLYTWVGLFPASEIFPNGIPLTESEQRMILYDFIKVYLQLEDYEDVFEEGQNG